MSYEMIAKPHETDWNGVLSSLPGRHLLQTWEWAEVKEEFGWSKLPLLWRNEEGEFCAAAMVLLRTVGPKIPGMEMKILYVPRGPVLDWNDRALATGVLLDLMRLAHREKAIFIKIDAELITGTGEPGTPEWSANPGAPAVLGGLEKHGWVRSDEQIQFANTVWVDLGGSEEEILARMKQKTRYNIRLAQKKGVLIRRGDARDFPILYKMYAETSLRDGFVIRSWEYYQKVWERFYQAGMLEPLLAEIDGTPVAGLLLFHFAGRAWYLYGMSTGSHREKMPNHLLQWEAIRRARAMGCSIYDLWGAPTRFAEGDPLWQVYRFKEGFAGKVVCTAGAWDYPSSRWKYALYMKLLPRILGLMRRRGKDRTRQEAAL